MPYFRLKINVTTVKFAIDIDNVSKTRQYVATCLIEAPQGSMRIYDELYQRDFKLHNFPNEFVNMGYSYTGLLIAFSRRESPVQIILKNTHNLNYQVLNVWSMSRCIV